jgi:hypothetical protein
MPQITFPSSKIIVRQEAKTALESKFPELAFRNCIKDKVVELHWESWDRTGDPVLPAGGEPENYISRGRHSKSAAETLGEVWEVVLPECAKSRHERRGSSTHKLLVISEATWDGADFFITYPNATGRTVVTQEARVWLSNMFGDSVGFVPLRSE